MINNGAFSVLDDLLHPDYVYRVPGQEEIKALFEAYRSAFPDLHVDIDDLVATGDRE